MLSIVLKFTSDLNATQTPTVMSQSTIQQLSTTVVAITPINPATGMAFTPNKKEPVLLFRIDTDFVQWAELPQSMADHIGYGMELFIDWKDSEYPAPYVMVEGKKISLDVRSRMAYNLADLAQKTGLRYNDLKETLYAKQA